MTALRRPYSVQQGAGRELMENKMEKQEKTKKREKVTIGFKVQHDQHMPSSSSILTESLL